MKTIKHLVLSWRRDVKLLPHWLFVPVLCALELLDIMLLACELTSFIGAENVVARKKMNPVCICLRFIAKQACFRVVEGSIEQ